MTELVTALFSIVGSALSIWDTKEKRKYLDKYIQLQKDYNEAINRSDDQWNDARIDSILFDLRLLVSAINSEIGKSVIANK